MNNSLLVPPESNFSSFLYHTPDPNFLLGDDCPSLPFHFSYFSRLTFLNIFNCIISQFPIIQQIIQQIHSKFLKVGTDNLLLCQHHLHSSHSVYSVQMNHYSLQFGSSVPRSRVPAGPSAYAAFLQTPL